MIVYCRSRLVALLAFALIMAMPGFAQQEKANAPESTGSIPPDAKPRTMNAVQLNLMIRSTLMALNHANLSGNYSVLRDLGSMAFQKLNTSASLAEQFAPLRKSGVDFTPIFYFDPRLKQQPQLQQERFLRLIGYVPTTPQQIDFDLTYQIVDNSWQLVAMAVGLSNSEQKVSSNNADAAGGKPPQPKAEPANAAQKQGTVTSEDDLPPKEAVRIDLSGTQIDVPTKSPVR